MESHRRLAPFWGKSSLESHGKQLSLSFGTEISILRPSKGFQTATDYRGGGPNVLISDFFSETLTWAN